MTPLNLGRIHVQRILCPVDLSATSRRALDHARQLAGWYDAELTVLFVRRFEMPPSDFPGGAWAGPPPGVVEPETVLEELRRFSGADSDGSPSIRCEVREGPPVPGIVQAATDIKADLIVLGTHGRSGFDRLMLGSIAEAVLRKAPCPVMTIPPHSSVKPTAHHRRLLAAIDFSPASEHAADYALSLAREDEALVTLLHVNEWPAYPPTWYESAVKTDALRKAVMETAEVELRRLVPDEPEWCRLERRVVTGRAHEEIVRVAHEGAYDLIVMGRHGRAVIAHTLFGSTVNQVVRHADCPVLSVPGRPGE